MTSHDLPSTPQRLPLTTSPHHLTSCYKTQNEPGGVLLRVHRAVPRMGTKLDRRTKGNQSRSRRCLELPSEKCSKVHHSVCDEALYDQPWGSLMPNLGDIRQGATNRLKPVVEGFYDQPWGMKPVKEGFYNEPCGTKPVKEGFYDELCGTKPVEEGFYDEPCGTKRVEEGFYDEPWGSFESNVVLDKYRINSRQVRELRKLCAPAVVTTSNRSENVNIPYQEKKCSIPANYTAIESNISTEETSSSAYNTGDSCCSTPLASPDQHADIDNPSEFRQHFASSSNLIKTESHNGPAPDSSNYCTLEKLRIDIASLDIGIRQDSTSDSLEVSSDGNSSSSNGSHNGRQQNVADEEVDLSLQELYTRYADVMYTNRDNLEHTMKVQQTLFEQQLSRSAHNSPRAPSSTQNLIPYLSSAAVEPFPARLRLTDFEANPDDATRRQTIRGEICVEDNHTDNNIHDSETICHRRHPRSSKECTQKDVTPPTPGEGIPMEWVIKRRGDGSRYVTRRPVKKQLMRERAARVAEQRCGMTTDDDVRSELKVGRYWSKDERRRQLEQSRSDRKLREVKENEKLRRMEKIGEGVSGGEGRPDIVEMSRRKMDHHKRKRGGALDNFLTVKEILAHGSQGAYKPLLSVTTV